MKNNKGFSLVELIVVIAIMAILAAVAIPTFSSFITKANIASDEQFAADLEYAIELALIEDGDSLDDDITVTITNAVVSEVKLGTDVIYDPDNATEANQDKYELANVVDFTYEFKHYTGTFYIVDGEVTTTAPAAGSQE